MIDLEAFVARAGTRLRPVADTDDDALPPPRGDFDLNPGTREEAGERTLRPAAVLVPIVADAREPRVILTHRAANLPHHGGQVSFPGGRRQPEDASLAETALRECEEEIALERARVRLIGRLESYETGTGFAITPFVGLVTPGYRLTPDPGEVAAIFETPLAFLMDPANHQRHSAVWRGRRREYFAMPYRGHYIWGATAGMLVALYETVFADA